MPTRILRFAWGNTFVLVRSQETGRDLDIELLATEGDAPYKFIVKAQKTSILRAPNAPCTQEEFDTVLFAILRGQSAVEAPSLKDVEVVVGVLTENSITLTIRKRTQGITQRLGLITLDHDEEQAIELFEWCSLATQTQNAIKDDLEALTSRFENQQSTITQLTKQLEDLLEAKKEHENQLLEKVALLLNEKKLKIRDQQRLLATAQVDPTKLARIQATRPPGGDIATSSRNKRKAPTADEDSDDSSDADKMDIDEPVADDSEEDEMTPDPDETASEAEEDSPPPPPPQKVKGRIGGAATKSHKSPTNTSKDKTVEDTPGSRTSSATVQHEDDVMIPPPRQLPFSAAKKAAAPVMAPQQASVVADDEETESDDEL